MSLWLRAICTRPLTGVTVEDLGHALDVADFASMAEGQGLDEEAGRLAGDSLRCEEIERTGRRWALLVHYVHHEHGDDWSMNLEVWQDPAEVAEEVAELLEDDPPEAARALLRAVASAGFDLKLSDVEGMGLPIAFELGMWLAAPERGDGLVEYEGEWWDPATFDPL